VDRSFSDDGMAEVNLGNGMTLFARDVLVQLDGKTVIVGSSTPEHYSKHNGDRIVVARLLLDGTPDPSFGPNGTGVVMTSIDADAHAYGAALQGDGKIIVAGTALETSGVNNYQHAVVRYNTDGSPDRSFDGDGIIHFNVGADDWWNGAHDVAVQNDGKIVVVGEFFRGSLNDDEEFSILRFNPDGSRDLSFGLLGLVVSDFSLPRDPSVTIDYTGSPATNPYYGSIIVAGWDHGNGSALVLRLRPNGQFDDGFDNDGQRSFRLFDSNTAAFDVIAQPGGKIVVAGTALGDFMLARFNPDGAFDPTFGDVGTGVILTQIGLGTDVASSIVSGGDRLLVAGSCNGNFATGNGAFALARYTGDGLLDTSFSSDGMVKTTYDCNELPRLAAGPGRRFTVAGGPDFHAMRFLDDGANMVAIGTFDANGGSESGPEEAHFLVTRTDRLPTPLRVFLNVGGTAAAPLFIGQGDYDAVDFSLSAFVGFTFVDIPANQTFVSCSIRPRDDTVAEGDETCIISIAADPSYDIGSPAGVTLEVHDNDASSLYAVADAHVRDGPPADANFGAANLLETQAADAPGTGQTAETYLKFDTSTLGTRRFSGVRLRVFGRVTGGAGPAVPAEVFGVSASGWDENAITFNNRPAPSTAALGRVEVSGSTEFTYTFDVTDFVNREKAAGRNVVTLLLRNAAVSADPTLWSSRFSEYSDPRLIVTSSIAAPGGTPRVTQVFAGSTAWTPAFRQRVEDAGLGDSAWGYAVGGGAEQLKSLPWGDVDTLSIRFTTAVNVIPEHLSVRGVRGGAYGLSGFTYDEANFVATWTLATPLGRGGEKVLLDLDGDAETGVASVFLRPRFLDGEWANGADAYDSGNGAEGGDFRFQVNALRGDVDGDGGVGAADLVRLRARLLRRASETLSGAATAYSSRHDLNGDGRIDLRDVTALRAELFSRLPVESPVAPVAAPLALRRPAAVRQRFLENSGA
jgi:uncharacterized delta-60 repeat protein